MKLLKKIALIFTLASMSSCAFLFNDKEVELRIDSNPAGADIMIDGVHYGKTPATLKLEPRNYIAVLNKEGYGTAQVRLESWQAVRLKKAEGGRCLADAFGTMLILPALSYWSVYCRDFKQPRYNVAIPYMGPAGSSPNDAGRNSIRPSNSPYSGGFPTGPGAYSREQFYDPSSRYMDEYPRNY